MNSQQVGVFNRMVIFRNLSNQQFRNWFHIFENIKIKLITKMDQ